MVLVDTSVWIDFLRNSRSKTRKTMNDLLASDRVATIEPIIAELLYGVRGEKKRKVVLDIAAGTRRLKLVTDTWIAAGDLGRAWRKKGRTLSVIDCVLAAASRMHSVPLWTLDRDFRPLKKAGEVRLFDPQAD